MITFVIRENEGVLMQSWAGAICMFFLVYYILWILLAVWVYGDAKKRGENAALWVLIVLLTGIIGFIVYLIVRPKEKAHHPPLPG